MDGAGDWLPVQAAEQGGHEANPVGLNSIVGGTHDEIGNSPGPDRVMFQEVSPENRRLAMTHATSGTESIAAPPGRNSPRRTTPCTGCGTAS